MQIIPFFYGVCFMLMSAVTYAQSTVVGKVDFVKGDSAAKQPNETPRILAKNSDIFAHDNIQTTERSFVIVNFVDGSKITVRPNSNFNVDNMDNKQSQLTVHEGSVRADNSQGQHNLEIKTPDIAVKSEKADYSISVCKENCESAENKNDIAKVIDLKGNVDVINGQQERHLSLGASLFEHDRVISKENSYAAFVFRDGEKMVLQPSSQIDIAQYDFQKNKKDKVLYKLVVGGMRVLTGSIGKKDPSAYAIDTPVATIGIRGTEFDLTCLNDCENPNFSEEDEIANDQSSGLVTHVEEGIITISNESGTIDAKKGQNHFISNKKIPPVNVQQLPDNVIELNELTPKPSKFKELHFSEKNPKTPNSFVSVHKGKVAVENNNFVEKKPPVFLASGQNGQLIPEKNKMAVENNNFDEKNSETSNAFVNANSEPFFLTAGQSGQLDEFKNFVFSYAPPIFNNQTLFSPIENAPDSSSDFDNTLKTGESCVVK